MSVFYKRTVFLFLVSIFMPKHFVVTNKKKPGSLLAKTKLDCYSFESDGNVSDCECSESGYFKLVNNKNCQDLENDCLCGN